MWECFRKLLGNGCYGKTRHGFHNFLPPNKILFEPRFTLTPVWWTLDMSHLLAIILALTFFILFKPVQKAFTEHLLNPVKGFLPLLRPKSPPLIPGTPLVFSCSPSSRSLYQRLPCVRWDKQGREPVDARPRVGSSQTLRHTGISAWCKEVPPQGAYLSRIRHFSHPTSPPTFLPASRFLHSLKLCIQSWDSSPPFRSHFICFSNHESLAGLSRAFHFLHGVVAMKLENNWAHWT